ncbi:MAG: hypothetical protein ACE148_09300 [Vicinamibacterales bacterium]
MSPLARTVALVAGVLVVVSPALAAAQNLYEQVYPTKPDRLCVGEYDVRTWRTATDVVVEVLPRPPLVTKSFVRLSCPADGLYFEGEVQVELDSLLGKRRAVAYDPRRFEAIPQSWVTLGGARFEGQGVRAWFPLTLERVPPVVGSSMKGGFFEALPENGTLDVVVVRAGAPDLHVARVSAAQRRKAPPR